MCIFQMLKRSCWSVIISIPINLVPCISPLMSKKPNRIAEKLEFHYTPKHGSWLNMAEIEFSVLRRQCLPRRIPDQETLKREVQAWQVRRKSATRPPSSGGLPHKTHASNSKHYIRLITCDKALEFNIFLLIFTHEAPLVPSTLESIHRVCEIALRQVARAREELSCMHGREIVTSRVHLQQIPTS